MIYYNIYIIYIPFYIDIPMISDYIPIHRSFFQAPGVVNMPPGRDGTATDVSCRNTGNRARYSIKRSPVISNS